MKGLGSRYVSGDGYLSSILALGSGAMFAQLVVLLATPILTRIYDPAQFGIFAVYLSLTGLIGVTACLRYEQAILLAEDRDEALVLLGISLSTTVMISVLTLLVVWLVDFSRHSDPSVLGEVLYLLPIAVFLRGVYQALNFFCTRDEQIATIAAARGAQAVAGVTTQIGMGHWTGGLGVGLVVGQLVGSFVAVAVLAGRQLTSILTAMLSLSHCRQVILVARNHSRFPRFDLPAGLLNTATYEIPALLLLMFFAEAIVGEVAIAMRLVMFPTALVSASMAQIYFKKAAEHHRTHGDARALTISTLRWLAFIGVPSFAALGLGAPFVVEPLLGGSWARADQYIVALTPMCFVMFLTAPVSQLFFVHQRQRALLGFQVLHFAAAVIAFTTAGWFGDALAGVKLFSMLVGLRYLTMLLFLCRLEKIGLGQLIGISRRHGADD